MIVLGAGVLTAIFVATPSEIAASTFPDSAAIITGDSAAHIAVSCFRSNHSLTPARTKWALGRTRRTSQESFNAPALSAGVLGLCEVLRALNFIAPPDPNSSRAMAILAPMSRRGPPASSFA